MRCQSRQKESTRSAMKTTSTIAMLLGFAVVTALITWQGAATVAGIIASTDWGIVLLMLLYLPHLAISTVAAAAKKPIRLVNNLG